MRIQEVRVISKGDDPLGRSVKQEAIRTLGLSGIHEVRTVKVYRFQGITKKEAILLAQKLLTDPLTEKFTVNKRVDFQTTHIVEIAYKPGVMNPEVASIMQATKVLGVVPKAVDSSHEYAFFGELPEKQVNKIINSLLVNKTVEHIISQKPRTLISESAVANTKTISICNASESELMDLSEDKLFLNIEEMVVIQQYFKKINREPTDVELEIIAARWSEHCGHKTFNAKVIVDGVEKQPLFERIKIAAKANYKDLVVSAFRDNSGVIKFYDGQTICAKVETHNSPSAIEPYGGAMTGSGGVFRDIMGTGQGAKVIISTDMFCFAPTDINESLLPPGTLSPDYIQRRVVQGVGDYGNRMGIPTANGSVHYHDDFRAKPTVMVGAYGIMPEKRAKQGEPQTGDLVVIIGGKTGRDGIHGATFSSGEMTDRTAIVNSSAVQIGNAIEEKRMSDALLEARDQDLIRAMTDCGAAGFSSAIGEMGEDVGLTVDIKKVPLKYLGLAPWEIWLSESQERMVAAVVPRNINAFLKICEKFNVEAVVLGEFDGSHTLTVNYGSEKVAELDYKFLAEGLPQRSMHAHWRQEKVIQKIPHKPKNANEWSQRLSAVLSHGNVCSKEPIVRQYDHGVQGGNVVSPFGGVNQSGPNDAVVIRPILNKPYGVVQSHGMNPVLNKIDPFEGTVWAIAEAASNYAAVGGNIAEAAAVGNYVWPYPDQESMGSLDRSVDAAVDMMHRLKLPVISGKDSLSSTYRGADGKIIKIPPVYTMSIFGRIPNVEKTMTSDIKKPGISELYLIGKQSMGMAGSTYYEVVEGLSNDLPKVDVSNLATVLQKVNKAIQGGHILACHDISEGGLVTAVTEMCIGGGSGAELKVPKGQDPERFLFNETAGCFIVEVSRPENISELFPGVDLLRIGRTTKTTKLVAKKVLADKTQTLFSETIDELKKAWQAPMKEIFNS